MEAAQTIHRGIIMAASLCLASGIPVNDYDTDELKCIKLDKTPYDIIFLNVEFIPIKIINVAY